MFPGGKTGHGLWNATKTYKNLFCASRTTHTHTRLHSGQWNEVLSNVGGASKAQLAYGRVRVSVLNTCCRAKAEEEMTH